MGAMYEFLNYHEHDEYAKGFIVSVLFSSFVEKVIGKTNPAIQFGKGI
jgi:hypothetical protein